MESRILAAITLASNIVSVSYPEGVRPARPPVLSFPPTTDEIRAWLRWNDPDRDWSADWSDTEAREALVKVMEGLALGLIQFWLDRKRLWGHERPRVTMRVAPFRGNPRALHSEQVVQSLEMYAHSLWELQASEAEWSRHYGTYPDGGYFQVIRSQAARLRAELSAEGVEVSHAE